MKVLYEKPKLSSQVHQYGETSAPSGEDAGGEAHNGTDLLGNHLRLINSSSYGGTPDKVSLEGSLVDSTPLQGAVSPTTRTVHVQPRLTANDPPQYGNFYNEYDPMTGARTAAILGSLLLMLVFYIIYKAKCHQSWTDEDDFYLQQYKQRQANKAAAAAAAIGGQNCKESHGRRGTNYVIDPVCSPDPTILAATAQWVHMQPLETAIPDPALAHKRRVRVPLSRYPSVSAENINRQLLNAVPPLPNGHGPAAIPSTTVAAAAAAATAATAAAAAATAVAASAANERSCNEYIPNGFLKPIYKDNLNEQVEFYIDEDERHANRRSSSQEETSFWYDPSSSHRPSNHNDHRHEHEDEEEVDDLFAECHVVGAKAKSGQHHLLKYPLDSSNEEEVKLPLYSASPSLEVCSDCPPDCTSGGEADIQGIQRTCLLMPNNKEGTPKPRRSCYQANPRQRSPLMESLDSHQASMDDGDDDDDDHAVFRVGALPPRDAAPVSLDITDMSSNENTSEQQLGPSDDIIVVTDTIAAVTRGQSETPLLSYIDNLANASTFSTMSTATASSNGSYQSEAADIPLALLPPQPAPLTPETPLLSHTTHPSEAPTHHTVEVSIETALQSSSKPPDQMDTTL